MILTSILFAILTIYSVQQPPYIEAQFIDNFFTGDISGADISPNGKHIIVTQGYYSDKYAVMFELNGLTLKRKGTEFYKVPTNNKTLTTQFASNRFSKDSKILIIGGNKLQLYDPTKITGDIKNAIPFQTIQRTGQNFLHFEVSADGKILFASTINSALVPNNYIFLRDGSGPLFLTTPYSNIPTNSTHQTFRISQNGKNLVLFLPVYCFGCSYIPVDLFVRTSVDPPTFRQSTTDFSSFPLVFSDSYRADITNQVMVMTNFQIFRIFQIPNGTEDFVQTQNLDIIAVGRNINNVKISPDNSRIFVTSTSPPFDLSSILIFKRTSNGSYELEKNIQIPQKINAMDISHNSEYLVFGNNNNNLFVYVNPITCVVNGGFISQNKCKLCDESCKTCSTLPTNCQSCKEAFCLVGTKCNSCAVLKNNIGLILGVSIPLGLLLIGIILFCVYKITQQDPESQIDPEPIQMQPSNVVNSVQKIIKFQDQNRVQVQIS